MKVKSGLIWFGLGMGSTLLYQQVKNGNLRKIVRNMNRKKTKLLEDIEDVM